MYLICSESLGLKINQLIFLTYSITFVLSIATSVCVPRSYSEPLTFHDGNLVLIVQVNLELKTRTVGVNT